MTVYPDLAFFLGLTVHGAVTFISLTLLDLRRPWWQILTHIFGSALLSALTLFPRIHTLILLLGGLLLSAFFYRGKTFKGTVLNFLTGIGITVLYLAVFLLLSGAIFTFELVFFDSGGILILSFVKSQISAFLAFLFLYLYVRARNKRAKEAFCCDCSVTLEGKKVPFRAYVDTGNFLTDPVSGRAVVILEFSLLRNAFGGEFPEPMTYEFSARFANRAKMIPYYSVSGEGKMLSAFLPESFTVNEIPRSVVVAVSDRPLECRGRFQGIIGPSLIGGNEL